MLVGGHHLATWYSRDSIAIWCGGNRLQDVQWMLNNSKFVDVDTDKEEWEDESQDKEDDDDDDYDDWLVVWSLLKNIKVSWNNYSQYMEK